VVAGDLLIGIPSSGPHSNGFSLLRKLLSLENIPLEPTRMYVDEILDNFSYIEAVAHITGGGLHGNIPRILGGRNYCIDIQTSGVWNQWWQDLFELGECTHIEFENVFNCGVGMVLVVKQKNLEFIQEGIPDARIVGKVL
jgi:phosphoribosylformylglycinamidine cyclo-ligase